MSKFNVISRDATSVRYEGAPQYSGTYLGVDYIEFKNISSPTVIDWQIGDYVDYFRTGIRYKLYTLPMPKKVARAGSYGGAIEYSNVQFFAPTKDLDIAPFRDFVVNDNGIHFSTRQDVSTYEDVRGIARRIQACMDDIFPGKWRIEVYETDDWDLNNQLAEVKEFSISQSTCLDALSQIYDTWKGIGWIHTTDNENGQEVITIGRSNVRDADNTTDIFAYGKGNGLTSIRKNAANEGEFATRLYVYGSERNLPARYYNQFNILNNESVDIRNLMIPISEWGLTNGEPDAKKAYIQADDALIEKYGLIPKTLYFDGSEGQEIYPSIQGLTMSQVRQAMVELGQVNEYLPENKDVRIDTINTTFAEGDGSAEDFNANPNIIIYVNSVGFNIAEQGKKTAEGVAKISIKSGLCAGRELLVRKLVECEQGKDGVSRMAYEVERAWDESTTMGYPNSLYPLNEGDEFVLLDIPMPDYYVSINEKKLLEQGKKMLADYTRVSAFYEPEIDAIRMKKVGGVVTPGMYMQVMDEDIIDTEDHTDYVLIDSLSIDEITEIPTYKITLREEKRAARTYSVLEDMIEDAREDAKQSINRERQYTDRRFRSAQETLKMLEGAFSNFSKGITPATVQTMAMLIGDESLQYKFTASRDSLVDVPCPLSWNPETKQMIGVPASLIHMTLDIEGIAPTGARGASDYKSWNIISWWDKDTFQSPFVEDAEKSYYVYVRASKESTDAWYYIDENSHSMIDDDYYFLVGILNSEYDSNRDFVTLYGFTEVLPGQITTDVIRSADGKTYFDLLRGEISGDIHFIAPDGSDKSITDYAQEQNEQFSLIDKDVKNLQDQIDGVVENHFYEGTPTTSNYPASSWTSDIQKINHIGDTYTDISNIESDPNAGKSWRWCRCEDMDEKIFPINIPESYKGMWYKIGNIDASASYYYCQLKKGETIVSSVYIFDFEQEYNIGWYNAGLLLRIDSSTGDVYIKDENNKFGNGYDLVLESSDYDFVLVTDKDGKTYPLHWHPIADTDAVKALLKVYELERKVDDAEYLKETFKKGETNISGGVVMTEMVAVGEGGDNIEAFLNGSDFAEDTENGKLILAGGIPTTSKSGSVNLEDRAKEAKIRMYEDGDFVMKDGGISVKRGNVGPLYIGEYQIATNEDSGGSHTQLVVGQGDLAITHKLTTDVGAEYDKYTQVTLGGGIYSSFGSVRDAENNKIFDLFDRSFIRGVRIETNDSGNDLKGVLQIARKGTGAKCAIEVERGYFAGLRPKTRVIKSTGSQSNPHTLTVLDHTIIINEWSNSTVYIKLPSSPQEGQVYEIYSSNASSPLSISSAGITMFVMNDGVERIDESFASVKRRYIKLVYADGVWWETYWQF